MASKENQEALNRIKDCHGCGEYQSCEGCLDIDRLQKELDKLDENSIYIANLERNNLRLKITNETLEKENDYLTKQANDTVDDYQDIGHLLNKLSDELALTKKRYVNLISAYRKLLKETNMENTCWDNEIVEDRNEYLFDPTEMLEITDKALDLACEHVSGYEQKLNIPPLKYTNSKEQYLEHAKDIIAKAKNNV